ncbi:MAG: (d)CMP kinase [Deltaproteobacteria bacterium]|nr:(d)CMP kinase [Deltaproteobacteria bacterium]
MNDFLIVALDGPGGVGKSTTGTELAGRVGLFFLSSGRVYRAMAWVALQNGWIPGENMRQQDMEDVVIRPLETGDLEVNDQVLGDVLVSEEISHAASVLSTFPWVRDRANGIMKETIDMMAREKRYSGVILEGRDIGTVVYPGADRKIFLTASVEERARRRHADLVKTNPGEKLEDVTRSLEERDRRDSTRDVAPLAMAQDALLVDSTGMTFVEVVQRMEQYLETGR